MPATKEKVIQLIQSLPDTVTLDDILAELFFRLQIDKGLSELDKGKGVAHGKARQQIKQWLTK